MDRFTIEIVGGGLVGTATGAALTSWGHEVVYKELRPDRREQLRVDGERVVAPEEPVDATLSLVCVPTPYDESSSELDMSHVEAAVDLLVETAPDPGDRVVGIRSTLLPGTTRRLGETYGLEHVAAVPEFLFAATAIEDARAVERLVVGAASERAREVIEAAYAHNEPRFVRLDPTEAELVKLTSNAYGATKISFANEMWRVAADAGEANCDRVLETFRTVSPWVGSTRGLAGGWPYGGTCLPKDTNGLRSWIREHGLGAPQLDGTIAENDLMRARGHAERAYGRW